MHFVSKWASIRRTRLKLVRVRRQQRQIRDAVQRRPCRERVRKSQAGESRKAAGAAAVDAQARGVGFALRRQVAGGVGAVSDIHNAPVATQPAVEENSTTPRKYT